MTRAKIELALLGAFGAFLLAVPWLVPAIADRFWVSVITEILIWALFAASVNLLFGYVGLLSFGQALFFGCGMYGVAIGIAKLGLGFWPALGLGIGCSAAMALIAGVFAVRLTWHYFAIITLVFSLIFYFLALTLKQLTGGDDGTSFTLPATFRRRLTASPLGRALAAIRENDTRAALIGLNVYMLRLAAFVISGVLAGVAGALFAFFGRYASATYMFYHVSGEAVVWTIVGGAGTLLGPLIGTSLFIIVREVVSTRWEHHGLIVGVVAILIVIFAPRGIVGLWRDMVERFVHRP